MDWSSLLSEQKSFVIAPAGHGKTYAIAECIGQVNDAKPVLVLTHTHAGIASLKEKLRGQNIAPSRYHIETISGMAQRYVLAFSRSDSYGEPFDKFFFDKIQKAASRLFLSPYIKQIIGNSFSHLIVDEYQDCTCDQHKMILAIADVIPTHGFGDHLQGIFDFNGTSVDFNEDLDSFTIHDDVLQTPHRWLNDGNNKALGKWIIGVRQALLSANKEVVLESIPDAGIEIIEHDVIPKIHNNDDATQLLYQCLVGKLREYTDESLLVIMPSFRDGFQWRGNIDDRMKMLLRFDYEHRFNLLEAIDDKSYYGCAQAIDEYLHKLVKGRIRTKVKQLYGLMEKCKLSSTGLQVWIDKCDNGDYHIISKRDEPYKSKSGHFRRLTEELFEHPNGASFGAVFQFLYNERGTHREHRPDVVQSILRCLAESASTGDSIFDSMCKLKNRTRRAGRKIDGRCFGTTLLTKGLEFDTVFLLFANRISDPRHFYVAISRACKHLVIFTESETIQFV